MIRVVLAIAILSCLAQVQARVPVSFENTVAAYENDRFEHARTSFNRMAEAGVPEAQFNLSVMMLNGQGGPANRVEAALWARVSADAGYEPAKEAAGILLQHLDDEQQSQYEERLPEWRDQYARSTLIERHRPEPCQSDCLEPGEHELPGYEDSLPAGSEPSGYEDFFISIDGKPLLAERTPPHYPREAAQSAIMGRVVLGGWLNADAELQHPHVVESFPEDVFSQAAMSAWTNWRFAWPEGAPEESPIYIGQQIIFTMDSMSTGLQPNGGITQRELESALDQAEQNIQAAHEAVWMIERLQLPLSEKSRPASVVSIVFQAAEAGVTRAQRDLAERQANGELVKQNRDAAIFWLKQAAFEGDAVAQFELSRWGRIEDEFGADLRRAAALEGFLPALLWELRDQVGTPARAEPAYLDQLLDLLPADWPHGNELIEMARRLAEP